MLEHSPPFPSTSPVTFALNQYTEIRSIRAEGNSILEEERARSVALQRALDAQQKRTKQLEEALQNVEVERGRTAQRNAELERQLQVVQNRNAVVADLMRRPLGPFVERTVARFRELLLRDNPDDVATIKAKLSKHHEERRLYTWLLVQQQLAMAVNASGPITIEQLAAAHEMVILTCQSSAELCPPDMLDWLRRADKAMRILARTAAAELLRSMGASSPSSERAELATLREQAAEHDKVKRQLDDETRELLKTREQVARLEKVTNQRLEQIEGLRQENRSLQEKAKELARNAEKRVSELPSTPTYDDESSRRIVTDALERMERAFLSKMPAEDKESVSAWFKEKRATLVVISFATIKELSPHAKDRFTEQELQAAVDRAERALVRRELDASAARELADWFKKNREVLAKVALATAKAMKRERERQQ